MKSTSRNLIALISFSLVNCFAINTAVAEQTERPFIWVKASERAAIIEKITTKPWAKKQFQTLRARADKATANSITQRREKLLALPLVWPEGVSSENSASGITPRLAFMQKKNKKTVSDRRALSIALLDAVDCGVMYYLSEEEQYGQCAADRLATIVNALAITPVPTGDWQSGWLMNSHLFEARMIGAQIPIIYDFAHAYLKRGGKVVDVASGELVDFDYDAAQKVFRTYINLAITKGSATSNWTTLEATSLVHNTLALDDKQERADKLRYFLDKDTDRQASLKTVYKMFEKPGDVWPESLQYSQHVAFFNIYLMTALDRLYPEQALGKQYSNIPQALSAYYNLQYPNDEYPSFGDGHRHYEVEYQYHEMALQLAKLNGNQGQAKQVADFLSSSITQGKYDRGVLRERKYGAYPYYVPLQLLWSQADLAGNNDVNVEPERPRTNRLPYAGMTIQRNISAQHPIKNSLMAFTAGGSYIHGHASGMDMELYGQGVVLGIDGGKDRYTTAVHENFHRQFAAHNTVISNGGSASKGGWVNQGINTVELIALEPALEQTGVSDKYSFTTSSFDDEFNLIAPAQHQRTLALIRLSDTSGYYLDIFRARSNTPNQYHDYLYHNIGDSLEITANGKKLLMKTDAQRYQASASLPWKNNRKYQAPGWHYFNDVKTSKPSDTGYQATFTASKLTATAEGASKKSNSAPVVMRALIPSGLTTQMTQVNAPPSYVAAAPYNKKPLPTFVMRNQGEAWTNPFAVVYESHTEQEGEKPAVQSVERLMQNGVFKGVKVVSNLDGEQFTQYVILQEMLTDEYVNKDIGITFKGQFSVLTLNDKGAVLDGYIGSGHQLTYKDFTLEADKTTYAGYQEK